MIDGAPSGPSERPPEVGARVGVYRLDRCIGEGGMGSVYLANRADGQFQQRVAIKLIRQAAGSAVLERRFLLERQILADLQHPHIARLLDGGITDDGRPYFVMEFVEGTELEAYCRQQADGMRARLELFLDVCRAVEYAHQRGVIHRDIKPSNILVTDQGYVKLLDFGIAKLADDPSRTALTGTGHHVFTPAYAAPEQLTGLSVTPATDVYQLGLVLYGLIAGRVPLGPTPSPPSVLGGGRASDIDWVCLKAMQSEPEQRYATAGSLADDVQRYLDGRPITARPATAAYRFVRFLVRNRTPIAWSGAFVLLALLGGYLAGGRETTDIGTAIVLGTAGTLLLAVGGYFLLRGRPADGIAAVGPSGASGMSTKDPADSIAKSEGVDPRGVAAAGGLDPLTIAVLPFENLSGTPEVEPFAAGIHDDLLNELSKVGSLTVISRTSVRGYRDSDKPVRTIASELGAGSLIEGGVQKAGDRLRLNVQLIDATSQTQRWSERYDRGFTASELLDLQSELAPKIASLLAASLSPEDSARLGGDPVRDLEAFRLCAQGRERLDQRTEQGMRRAAEYFRQASEHDPDYVPAWVGLGDALGLLASYGYEPFETGIPDAELAVRRALELDPQSAEAHASLGLLRQLERQGPEMLRLLERATELRPGYAEAHNWLCWASLLIGRSERALQSARRAVALDPRAVEPASNLVWALVATGRPEAALEEARRTRQLELDWPTGSYCEALVRYELGQFDQAVGLLRGLEVTWTRSGTRTSMAVALAAAGDELAARELLDGLHPEEHAFDRGMVLAQLGDRDGAFRAFDRVTGWTDWANLAFASLFRRLWRSLEDDPRFVQLEEAAARSWGFQPAPRAARFAADRRMAPAVETDRSSLPDVDSRSIAVLPFENVSQTEEAEPLAAGLHDDVLTALSRVPGLTVISRTSVRAYRGTEKPVRQIARELRVGTLIEGGVQSAADRLRLNVQLVDAVNDVQKWAETYDAELSAANIFDLQADLTRRIVESLQLQFADLSGPEAGPVPTEDLEAYRLYAQGRSWLDQRTENALGKALDYFRHALDRDESYARAWAGAAEAVLLLSWYNFPIPDHAPDAAEAARRALELAPDLGEAYASLGILHASHHNAPAARRDLERAIELGPGDAEAHIWLSWILLVVDEPVEALARAERALELDPLSPVVRVFTAEALLANRAFDRALAESQRARELQPGWALTQFTEAVALYHVDRLEEADRLLDDALALTDTSGLPSRDHVAALQTLIRVRMGDRAAARAWLAERQPLPDSTATRVGAALVLAGLGDHDAAADTLHPIEEWGPLDSELVRHYFPAEFDPIREGGEGAALRASLDRSWGLRPGLSRSEG